MPTLSYEFGPFALDPIRRVLTRDDVPVRARPMVLALLCRLAEADGRVVPKQDLLETLWPDGAPSDGNLTVTIAEARKALGDTDAPHRYLITVPRAGYRLVMEAPVPREPAAIPRLLAILPIEVTAGEHGLTDQALPGEIRRAIAHLVASLQGVRIVEPDGASIVDGSLADIVRALGVECVLTATIEVGEFSVELELKAVDLLGVDRWHSRITQASTELHTLPIRAAREVVGFLNPSRREPVRARRRTGPEHSEAWRAYLQGSFQFASGEGFPALHRAAVSFQRAVELEPDMAQGHAGLVDVLLLLRTAAMTDADEAASRIREAAGLAYEHGPLLPEAHLAMATVAMILDHDWRAAREHLMTALEFGPNHAWAHARYALYLAWRRQFEAALDSIHRAQSLDPFSMRIASEVAKVHYFAGQFEVALSILESATTRKVDFATGWLMRCWFNLGRGDGDSALAALRPVRAMIESTALWDAFTGCAHAVAGRAEPAHEALAALRQRREAGDVVPAQFDGMIQISLGDFEGATESVRRSAEERYAEFPVVEADPLWEPLRSWPGYEPIRREYFSKGLIDA